MVDLATRREAAMTTKPRYAGGMPIKPELDPDKRKKLTIERDNLALKMVAPVMNETSVLVSTAMNQETRLAILNARLAAADDEPSDDRNDVLGAAETRLRLGER